MSSDGGSSMNQSIRSLAQSLSFLAVAAALAVTPTPSSAADVTLLAVTAPQWTAEPSVQDMGRIEAASGHAAAVWRELARHARHPDAGSASPRRLNGTVDVAFEVNGDGLPGQAEIAGSSQAYALEGAALRTVRRARFPSTGGEARRYVVTFDYRY